MAKKWQSHGLQMLVIFLLPHSTSPGLTTAPAFSFRTSGTAVVNAGGRHISLCCPQSPPPAVAGLSLHPAVSTSHAWDGYHCAVFAWLLPGVATVESSSLSVLSTESPVYCFPRSDWKLMSALCSMFRQCPQNCLFALTDLSETGF